MMFNFTHYEAMVQENARLREALRVAADDLDKATNQFESIRLSQAAGFSPRIEVNQDIFEAKAVRARAALGDQTEETA